MTLFTSLVIPLSPTSKFPQKCVTFSRYCGGNTQVNNFTSMFSGDAAYISQFSSNGMAYIVTEKDNLSK